MKYIREVKQKATRPLGRLYRRAVECLKGQGGFGTVEIVLLLLVLVGLVLIFKDEVTDLVSSVFGKIASKAGKL